MEACITCMVCMTILKEPATCSPCGHTFCSRCLQIETQLHKQRALGIDETADSGSGDADGDRDPEGMLLAVCPECTPGPARPVVNIGMLATLTSKFGFQKQCLAALQLKPVESIPVESIPVDAIAMDGA